LVARSPLRVTAPQVLDLAVDDALLLSADDPPVTLEAHGATAWLAAFRPA
jgi:hypothetical protein